MRTNLAIYLQKFDDIQKTISATNPDTQAFETYTVNAAKAEIAGVDFDVLIVPIESLQISLAYAYVDPQYNKWNREYPSGSGVIEDFSDAPFVYIPKHSLTGSVRYLLPLDAAIGDVSLMGSIYWQDDTIANDAAWLWPTLGWSQENLDEALASTVVNDYAVLNFRVDWQGVMGSSFDLAAFVNNAADEDYITGGLNVPDSLGWAGANYGPPRTYGASLRYRF
jgi:iron complex outermembrane recepter protein